MPVWRAFELAFAHDAAGRHDQARRIYELILASMPEHPGALLKLAEGDLREGSEERARERLERALRAAARQSMPTDSIWWTLGRLHETRGRIGEARAAYEQCVAAAPGSANGHAGLGAIALAAGDAAGAEASYRAAIDCDPERVDAWLGVALASAAMGMATAAIEAVRKARSLAPDEPEVPRVESDVLLVAGDVGGALAVARTGCARHPGHASLLHALGNALRAMGAAAQARSVLAEAAALAPGRGDILTSLVAACLDAGRPVEARENAERALAAGFDRAELWDNLGLAHQRLGNDAAAARAFGEAVARKPELAPALANLLLAQRSLADWDHASPTARTLLDVLEAPSGDARCPPFVALLTDASMVAQLRIARRWSARMLPAARARRSASARGAKLRIGYLSADFREHAISYLIAGLFEHHDRRHIETFGYSYGPDDGSAIRRRVAFAFAHWRDLRSVGDAEAAAIIEADALDVLVDLNGHTLLSRLGILGRRPAPFQLHYLGYPGTLGYDAIDGIVADDVVAPAEEDALFAERVLRLPRCYQVNDAARTLPPPPQREALGLPDDALVLASFNNPNKLSSEFFAIWMAALSATPSAVLWLYAPGEALQRNLRTAASRHVVDPARLRFAPKVGQAEHVARLRCADLALDVLPYGAHTTASDVLWAGVPLVTCRGATFAGRVGASVLGAAGLLELVAESPASYGKLVQALASDRERLRGYRRYLERHRRELPLFDTAGFARDFERLLEDAANRRFAAAS